MSAFIDFKEKLLRSGLEWFGLYYGTYEGTVISNEDKNGRGQLLVSCPSVWGNDKEVKILALPRGQFSGKKIGFYAMPQEGDVVWLTFRYGKPELPLWEYGWWLKDEKIEGAEKDVYIFATPKGHTWVVDEKNDKIYFNFKNGKAVEITKNNVKIGELGGTQEKSTLGETTKAKLEELCSRLEDLCDKIGQITVPTAMGASGTPINAPDFVALKAQVTQLKNDLPDILSDVMTNE